MSVSAYIFLHALKHPLTHEHTLTLTHTCTHARTYVCAETPLTESGKARLVRYGWLLAMASKRVGCSSFLPTMERDSYIERDSQKATDKREIMS